MYNADDLMQRITIDPYICHGKPCIRGLRYPVEILLELLSAGMTVEEILADYEDLEQEDIFAALVFATRLSQVKRIQPLIVRSFSWMRISPAVWRISSAPSDTRQCILSTCPGAIVPPTRSLGICPSATMLSS
jgi:uncharacterized protein (DUF433 family)